MVGDVEGQGHEGDGHEGDGHERHGHERHGNMDHDHDGHGHGGYGHMGRGAIGTRGRGGPPGPGLCGLDLDGVLCDLGPGVAARIEARFGVASHPATWRTFDLRRLPLGVPSDRFGLFIDEVFADPDLYVAAPPVAGALEALVQLRAAGWVLVGITARPPGLARVTEAWLDGHGMVLDGVHHVPLGTKAVVAERLGATVTIEDNPEEAELLGTVCESWLIDRPYNRDQPLRRARRLRSWDHAVGQLCQLRLFA